MVLFIDIPEFGVFFRKDGFFVGNDLFPAKFRVKTIYVGLDMS